MRVRVFSPPGFANPRASDGTAQKIRCQKRGYPYAHLSSSRSVPRPPPPGCDPARWLRETLVTVGARNVRHRGAQLAALPSPTP